MTQGVASKIIYGSSVERWRLNYRRGHSKIKENDAEYHNLHDRGYKYLLSSKKIFLELLRSFVQNGWVDQIDESDVVKMDKSYNAWRRKKFGDGILDFKYILLDVQRYLPKDLIELSNVIGSAFLLDQKTDRDELITRLKKVMSGIEQAPHKERQRFFTWLTHILSRKVPKEQRQEVEQILSEIQEKGMNEVISNLERTLDGIKQEGWQQGEKESKEKIAKKLLLKGMDSALVAEVTDLPLTKIEAINKQL